MYQYKVKNRKANEVVRSIRVKFMRNDENFLEL